MILGVTDAIDEVRALYPWARGVVCGAVSHLPPDETPPDDRPRGVVARFARSADYHTVVREKLVAVAQALRGTLGDDFRAEICVDTTPIPERLLAVRAGIARMGRNGCAFVEKLGSWVSLGEIVTDVEPGKLGVALEVEVGQHSPGLMPECDDCDICVRACPAGALDGAGLVDERKCLSAVTQRPDDIDEQTSRALGLRLYGCDTCQEVCPANAGVSAVTPDFAVSVFPGAYPELGGLIDLTAREFGRVARSSCVGWIGRPRLRRNALIVAENIAMSAREDK